MNENGPEWEFFYAHVNELSFCENADGGAQNVYDCVLDLDGELLCEQKFPKI